MEDEGNVMRNQGRTHYNDDESSGEVEEEVREKPMGEFDYQLVSDFSGKAKGIGESTLSGGDDDDDPLVDSIFSLQFVQELLEKEVHEFSEIIASEHVLLSEVNHSPLDCTFRSVEIEEECSSSSSSSSSTSLQHEVDMLKKKLEDSIFMLNQKEAKVIELENAVKNGELEQPEEEFLSMLNVKRELEEKIDDLFKKRIEAEIKQIAMRRQIQKIAVEQIALLEGRNSTAKVVNKLEDVKRKASDLSKKAERLEMYCNDIVGSDEVLKLENRVRKYSLCFLTQFILLVLFFIWLNLLKFSPPPPYIGGGDVPT
ncbi:WPP domain-interacting protein 1-like [Impatiens glandulifera]|uniref:WPP domain-interacting protein 1-like n=1 Tax=Impatiens glandulifera TaxID=253017 RepID=UPI001FB09C66|nr:WPP domain-interacting protein 1-like [Impatiens glandulifera]